MSGRGSCGLGLVVGTLAGWLLVGALVAGAGGLASRFLPRTIWEQDEAIFVGSAYQHDLWRSSPQPPGAPLWSAIGSRFRDPESGLKRVAFLATLLAAAPLFVLGAELAGPVAGIATVLIWLATPVTILFAGRAFADPPALPFLFASWALLAAKPKPARFAAAGAVAGLALGFRPHLVVVVAAALLAALPWREWRRAAVLAGAFVGAGTGVVAIWSWPLVVDSGGLGAYLELLHGRADYVGGALDAHQSAGSFDSFLVKAYLDPLRALVMAALATAGMVLAWRRGAAWRVPLAALASWTILLYEFQNRAFVRYAPGWAALVALFAAAGLALLARNRGWCVMSALVLSAWLPLPARVPLLTEIRTASPPAAVLGQVAAWLDPERDAVIADSIYWSFLRTERWRGRLELPTEDANLLRPDRNPWRERFRGRRVGVLEDRTAGDAIPVGPRAMRFAAPELAAIAQDRLLHAVFDPDAVGFAAGAYPFEFPLLDAPFRWLSGKAWLLLPPASDDRVLLLEVDVPPWYGRLPLHWDARIGEHCLATAELVPGHHWLRIEVPAARLDPLASTPLVLETDRSLVPADHPALQSRDPRWLAYRLRQWRWLEASAGWSRVGGSWQADIGHERILARLGASGFHEPELAAGAKWFRWSDGAGRVHLPPGQAFRRIRLSALGQPAVGSTLELRLDGRRLGRLDLPPGWFVERSLELPTAVSGASLELVSQPWSPAGDRRRLGIAVERVVLE